MWPESTMNPVVFLFCVHHAVFQHVAGAKLMFHNRLSLATNTYMSSYLPIRQFQPTKPIFSCLYHSCNVFALIERPWGISLTLISLFYFLLCLVEPLCDWKCFVFTKDQKFAHTDLFIWMGECVLCFVGCWSTDDHHKKQFRKKFVPQFYLNTPNQFRIRPQTRTHSSFLKVISFPLFLSLTWWPLLWVSAHVPLF